MAPSMEKQVIQREMMIPFVWSKELNLCEHWNQGTPPSRPHFWNKCIEVKKYGLPELRQWGILKKGTRYHSRVTDGMKPRMMMERNIMSGEQTTSLSREWYVWLTWQKLTQFSRGWLITYIGAFQRHNGIARCQIWIQWDKCNTKMYGML